MVSFIIENSRGVQVSRGAGSGQVSQAKRKFVTTVKPSPQEKRMTYFLVNRNSAALENWN